MINQTQHHTLCRLIEAYRDAAIEDSWKGGGDPADIPGIERTVKCAKDDLNAFIDEITAPADTVAIPACVQQAQAMLAVANAYLKEHS
jgi:hypothetical protein